MRLLLALSLVVAAGCASASLPTREPDTVGIVTRIADDASTILVEERPQDLSGSAKTSVRITGDTRVWKLDLPATRAQPRDVRVGMTVRVWFDGPVATSYPGQARAGDIAIDAKATGPGLYVISRGAADVTVRLNGRDAATVRCNEGVSVRPRADGTPDLPWEVTVTRVDAVVLRETVTELPRWVFVERDGAHIGTVPLGAAPLLPCP